MTTISAGAAAGLLVALMVILTTDGYGADLLPAVKAGNGFVHPGNTRGFNPQPDPPRETTAAPQSDLSAVMGDGSVKRAGR